MDFDLIINLIGNHNDSSILLTEKYKPKEVLFLYRNHDLSILDSIEKYYDNNFSCSFLKENIDEKGLTDLENIMIRYKNKKVLFNLTSGEFLDILILYTFALKNKISCQFLDIKNKELINMSLDEVTIRNDKLHDLNIEDIIKSIGGSIVIDSGNSLDEDIIHKITLAIADNLDIWEKYRLRLTDPNLFIHDNSNSEILKIDTNYLNDEESVLIRKCLDFLEKNNQIKCINEDNYIKIIFLNDFIKSFIFKSGTWFEIFTKLIIKEIKAIDEVKSGVVFLWSGEKTQVRNELDVLAVKDSILICISCKDSKKYDEVALNELDIYAEQLGGASVKKILVATMEPSKSVVINRAEEMGIKIVIYTGDKYKFKKDLQNIICEG
ncbi:MAG: DUF1887 family CARF protein [Clostridium perfringens]|nr:DUF1887 family CARF protein [Clostridium perfringens]